MGENAKNPDGTGGTDYIRTFTEAVSSFMRFIFPGLVAVMLWKLRSVQSLDDLCMLKIEKSEIYAYAVMVLIWGVTLFILARMVLAELAALILSLLVPRWFMRGTKGLSPSRKRHFVAYADFVTYRTGGDFDKRISEYLLSRWSWTHSMASLAILFWPGVPHVMQPEPGSVLWAIPAVYLCLFFVVFWLAHVMLWIWIEKRTFEGKNG